MSRLLAIVVLANLAAAGPARALAQSAWQENFEGPQPSWRAAGGDVRVNFPQHQRVGGVAHTGQGCEWLQVVGQGAGSAYVAHDVGRPVVIEDLRPRVWIRADRPGLQFLAEITLPASVDPRTGQPITVTLLGPAYTDTGRWQQLAIDDIPHQLTRQIRILRSQLSMNVDGRDAYLNRVLLNVYGGPGATNVWIDDLEVGGHVASRFAVSSGSRLSGPQPVTDGGPAATVPQDVPPARQLKLDGAVLLVGGYPMFPRAVQYQGERLATLRQLGFNTVWLREPPPPDMLQEARQLGLWLICPPPVPATADSATTIGPEFEPVLAWDLREDAVGGVTPADQLAAHRRWADRVGRADARAQRPLICCPTHDLRAFSRHVNLLLIDRRPLGTSLEMPDYGNWVRRQPLMALIGTPVWTTIQTQPSESLRRQLAALAPGTIPPSTVAPEQMRLLAYTAISAGSRGLLFLSQSSLEATDAETRQRAMTLQLLNLELDVIELWAAAGTPAGEAEDHDKHVTGAVLWKDRARLVLPIWLAPGSQCVAPQAAVSPLSLLMPPGVPGSSTPYEISPVRLQPLKRNMDAGGMRITLDDFGLSTQIVILQDAPLFKSMSQRVTANGRSIAELERLLAMRKLETVTQVIGLLAGRMPPKVNVAEQLATARQALDQSARYANSDQMLVSGYARKAMSPLRLLERAAWENAMAGVNSPVTSPGTAAFATLPWHWVLAERVAAARPGVNRLPYGDFESLDAMRGAGWHFYSASAPGVQIAADPVPEAAHSGRAGLRLTAWPNVPEHPPAMIEMPPLWVVSPPVPVDAGQLVRIHGWVNILSEITGSVDGLQVIDSLGGEDLSARFHKTKGWQEFTLIRTAVQSGPMTVSLVLTGLGEVRVDDMTIDVLDTGPRRPAAAPTAAQGPAMR